MSPVRIRRTLTAKYSVIPKEIILNRSLSTDARFFLCWLICKDDILRENRECSECSECCGASWTAVVEEGADPEKMEGILKELEDAGYLTEKSAEEGWYFSSQPKAQKQP